MWIKMTARPGFLLLGHNQSLLMSCAVITSFSRKANGSRPAKHRCPPNESIIVKYKMNTYLSPYWGQKVIYIICKLYTLL